MAEMRQCVLVHGRPHVHGAGSHRVLLVQICGEDGRPVVEVPFGEGPGSWSLAGLVGGDSTGSEKDVKACLDGERVRSRLVCDGPDGLGFVCELGVDPAVQIGVTTPRTPF